MHNDHKNTKFVAHTYENIDELFTVKDLLVTDNPIKEALGITEVIYDKGTNSVGSKGEQYKMVDALGSQRIILYDKEVIDEDTGEVKHFPRGIYYNDDRVNDKGDLSQFIQNRIEGKNKKDVLPFLERFDFFNQAALWKENINVEYAYLQGKVKASRPFNLSDFENLRSIEEDIKKEKKHYLNERGIKNETLLSAPFKGKVMVYDFRNYQRVHKNIFFPKHNRSETIKGTEIKPTKGKGYCFGKDDLLWHSNKPEVVKKVMIVESALNAISHYQLHPEENKNTWYFSTNGKFYEARIDRFFHELENQGVDKKEVQITLGTDKDFDGIKYDVAVVNRMLEGKDNFKVDDDYQGKRSVSFETYDIKRRSEVHKYFMLLNETIQGTEIFAEENKLHLTFPSKEKIGEYSMLVREMKENIPFLQEKNFFMEKAPKFNDWNDVVQYEFDKKQFTNLKPIADFMESEEPHMLVYKGISNDLLLDRSFANKVFLFDDKDKDSMDVTKKMFFAKHKEGHLIGAEVSDGFKIENKGNPKTLWTSNKPKEVDRVVIVEQGLNALSHKQLDPASNENTYYISTGRRYKKEVVDEIFNNLKSEGIDLNKTLLEVGTDNNLWSVSLELQILNRVQSEGRFRVSLSSKPDFAEIIFTTKETKNLEDVGSYFKDLKKYLNEKYLNDPMDKNRFIKFTEDKNFVAIRFPNKEKLKKISHAFTGKMVGKVGFLKQRKLSVQKSFEGNNLNDKLRRKIFLGQAQGIHNPKKKVQHKINYT
ncbi:hypothetical protein [Aquimarina mytili]|uniref:Uncharacterized protein n=1 Tax=Aquimarina mytili TaxID=874423 RepID=A0A937D7Z1_9FLAO|nr:hypothetical protein [Aquimarina mytili]MBL0686064.1 hypothetical protein [Aquimarina mytili]